jgi:LPXTG-motif cell wall-anchored protein
MSSTMFERLSMASRRSAWLRRILVTVALPLAFATTVAAAPASAAAATTSEPAPAAAGWLATQMAEGKFLQSFGMPDAGLTLDAVLAFAAARAGGDQVSASMAWLTQPAVLQEYTYAFTSTYSAGETAKVILAMQVSRVGDPTNVDGIDLIAQLKGMLHPDGDPSAGLYQNAPDADPATGDDDTNAFDQALAVLAVARTAGGVPASAVSFLADSQCDDGSFPLFYTFASCGSVDATAMVIQALLAAGHPELTTDAVAWLVSKQDANGGFGDGLFTAVNSNSTGLAAQALRAAGSKTTADKAVTFLLSLQVGCNGPAANRGAIAYTAKVAGDDNTGFNPDTAPRATTQAILGLVGTAFGDLDGKSIRPGLARLECPVPAAPELPATGSSLTPVVVVGVALILLGIAALALVRGRRRSVGTA